jgi:putative ABC transport system permease protein
MNPRQGGPSASSRSSRLLLGWTPALRIARRGVKRNLGRSILIASLIAIPVAGATLVDVLARTLSAPAREAERTLGAADAQLGKQSGPTVKHQRGEQRLDFKALLPQGTRIVPAPSMSPILLGKDGNTLQLTDPDLLSISGGGAGHVMIMGHRTAVLVRANPNEPMHRQAVEVIEGRAPQTQDEALVTRPLADRVKVELGSKIETQGHTLTVTGVARSPFCLSCEEVVMLPDPGETPDSVLVQLPPGTDKAALYRTLDAKHVGLYTRENGDYNEATSADAVKAAALVTLIAGFGLLEVILLAGTAFAVGARRQVRTLGLVAASGGTPDHVRRIVLAEGVVLGLLGALGGAAVGIAVALALHPVWEGLDDAEVTSYVFRPADLTATILIGMLAGVVAAAAPAIGAARMKPIDALAGRFRVTTLRNRRTPAIGVALLAVGALAGLAGNQMLAGNFSAYEKALARVQQTGGALPQISGPGPVIVILFGTTMIVAAIVILAPSLIGRLARAGASLPVAGRLAVRDAARHRHRTGPTTAAIAVAVAGSVVIACVIAATNRAQLLQHVAGLPSHTLSVEAGPNAKPAAQAAAQGLSGAQRISLTIPLGGRDPAAPPDLPIAEVRGLNASAPCSIPQCETLGAQLALGDAQGQKIAALIGADTAAVKRQLAAGRIVLFGAPGTGGPATLTVHSGPTSVKIAGYVAERPQAYMDIPVGLVPEALVKERGWDVTAGREYVTYSSRATTAQVDAALARASAKGAYARIEGPPDIPSNAILLIVVIGAAFVTLAGAAISIALSSAEGRADLATLAAVGAAPRRRRALAASQALLIAGTGCALGVLAGTFVAYTLRATTGAPGFVVPWANLATTAIIVPLLAMAVAAIFTPSRLPLVRRAA